VSGYIVGSTTIPLTLLSKPRFPHTCQFCQRLGLRLRCHNLGFDQLCRFSWPLSPREFFRSIESSSASGTTNCASPQFKQIRSFGNNQTIGLLLP